MLAEMVALAIAECREPASSDIGSQSHRSESSTGYSLTGCSPAEPASASPVTDTIDRLRSGAQSNVLLGSEPTSGQCRCNHPRGPEGVISTLRAGCHFYLAPTNKNSRLNAASSPTLQRRGFSRMQSVFSAAPVR
jgi:hypothetical protein